MKLKELFKITRGTKVILVITFAVSAAAVIFAIFYYRTVNRSEDPRIYDARKILTLFDNKGDNLSIAEAFNYLDSAFSIFDNLPDYKTSFEKGVIFNNKCSVLLMKALYDSTISDNEKSTLLRLSMNYCDSSIAIYEKWVKEWGTLSEGEISGKITPMMRSDQESFAGLDFDKILKRRVRNLVTAQIETPRRLSVSLTNKGTIFRHLMQADSAFIYYNHALSLWKENRTAESNLSVLMGGEPVKPSLIKSLFPPDKNKK
jgi:tetratricopeptide (TPR) repeat protein